MQFAVAKNVLLIFFLTSCFVFSGFATEKVLFINLFSPFSLSNKSQVGSTLSLGSLRYDVFLDYADKLKDNRAKAVVKKYHSKLIGDVNKEITDRNTARLKAGKFVYPYFLPKWITNSIQT